MFRAIVFFGLVTSASASATLDVPVKVLNSFNSEYSSANGLLDFCSYNRYLFYSLGFLIGILGQVAGVKPADAK